VWPEHRFRLLDLVTGLADAMDLVSPALFNHHRRVAGLSVSIASEMGIPPEERAMIAVAALLHDAGALSLGERTALLGFDGSWSGGSPMEHAYMGYVLLRGFPIFSTVARIVRYHHQRHDRAMEADRDVAQAAAVVHLADRVDTLFRGDSHPLVQVPASIAAVERESGKMFCPEAVAAFKSAATRESFWLDSLASRVPRLNGISDSWNPTLDPEELANLCKVYSVIIDFRSRFTATHSAGVSATAEVVARQCGFSDFECMTMKLAGLVHDLGKLAVPSEVLEKPARLTADEFALIRSHTYHTYRILDSTPGMDQVARWAAHHHERLDGTGYPFHKTGDELSLGSRIMAVSDVLTAITEDRPYRPGMPQDKAMSVLDSMVAAKALDGEIVDLVRTHFDKVDSVRATAQRAALAEFDGYMEKTGEFSPPS